MSGLNNIPVQGLYNIFLKPNSDEKYQFHFETEQFMDKDDRPMGYRKKFSSHFLNFLMIKKIFYFLTIKTRIWGGCFL